MSAALIIVGSLLAVSGTILVGFPEVVPYFRAIREAAHRLADRWRARFARLFRRHRANVVPLTTAVSSSASMSFEVLRGNPFDGITETDARVDKLVELYPLLRSELDNLQAAHRDAVEKVGSKIVEGDAAVRDELEKQLRAEINLYLPQRAWGVLLLVVGTVLLAAATFV